jgi:AcrR family transcriptional regulator
MRTDNGMSARPGANPEGRADVLAVAAEAFTELGYDRASMDEIADRMGATKGRIYHYYRRKLDILLDIHVDMLSLMLERVSAVADGDGDSLTRLEEMAYVHTSVMMENLAYAKVTLFSSTQLDSYEGSKRSAVRHVRKLRQQYEALFAACIDEAVQAGLVRELDPEVAIRAFLGVLNWIGMWYRPTRPADEEAVARELATFAVGGLLPHGRL